MSTLFLGYDQELLWSLRKIRQKKAKTKRHLLLVALEEKGSEDKASRYLSKGPCL